MGMSTHVVGFRPPDAKFKKFAAIWKQCEEAGISPPKEVDSFFESVPPDPKGVEIDLDGMKNGPVSAWRNDSCDGYEVDLTKLPKDVTVLRFYNSW